MQIVSALNSFRTCMYCDQTLKGEIQKRIVCVETFRGNVVLGFHHLFQCSKDLGIYDMHFYFICIFSILFQCSKYPALHDIPQEKICIFLILLQCSKDPGIYDMPLEIICRFLILFQCSKDPVI